MLDFIYDPIKLQLDSVDQKLNSLSYQNHSVMKILLDQTIAIPGKRIRPALTLLVGKALQGEEHVITTMAAAIELLHVASLIHDDMVDHANTRRGQPTVSKIWGNNVAVMFGDFVFASSAVYVCETDNVRVIKRFSETIQELSIGQIIESINSFDANVTIEDYKKRIYNKTATLFRTAAESSAILSNAPEETIKSFISFGYNLGMAFQIMDDILDFEGSEEVTGKPVGNDLLEGTVTLPTILLFKQLKRDDPLFSMFKDGQSAEARAKVVEMIQSTSVLDQSHSIAEEFCNVAHTDILKIPDSRERDSLVELINFGLQRKN
ncbi:MAG: heptaprenyl diphosphate synthase/octaprenyl-diphosphate synthase [Chloroflexi bacterium]|jgi:geranylgeranyl pyrophosphate synthase|nr:MAG: heptaprenyl diphosphate synthase/octaprenyl-diphosphate synthase [Chloroflexota bacterium]